MSSDEGEYASDQEPGFYHRGSYSMRVPNRERRLQIERAQMIADQDIKRLEKLREYHRTHPCYSTPSFGVKLGSGGAESTGRSRLVPMTAAERRMVLERSLGDEPTNVDREAITIRFSQGNKRIERRFKITDPVRNVFTFAQLKFNTTSLGSTPPISGLIPKSDRTLKECGITSNITLFMA